MTKTKDYSDVLKILDKLTADSKLTEADALELGEAIKKSAWKRYLKKIKCVTI
ncbi:MAG: hypothetical protein Q7S22_07660 [Candidatus Micrarchaeota archaeon]|nr:hypothetical protein [Candidatus Micrarchaeota archaeon]